MTETAASESRPAAAGFAGAAPAAPLPVRPGFRRAQKIREAVITWLLRLTAFSAIGGILLIMLFVFRGALPIFTDPEIATVGYTQADVDAGKIDARVVKLPLLRNPRAKMQGIRDGFVKIFCRPGTGIVVGGVVVAPRASELIHPVSIAVDNNMTVEQIANAFTVYPSLSGSIAEVARQLHTRKGTGEV